MRFCWVLFILFGFQLSVAAAEDVTVCYNYGCSATSRISLTDGQLATLHDLFKPVSNAIEERAAIAQAVGLFMRYAAEQSPVGQDRGENYRDGGVNGQMDCIDHSTNVTTYLQLIEAHQWLKFHQVQGRIKRSPWWVSDHWAVEIKEQAEQHAFIVDSWFLDSGRPALIFAKDEWLSGARP